MPKRINWVRQSLVHKEFNAIIINTISILSNAQYHLQGFPFSWQPVTFTACEEFRHRQLNIEHSLAAPQRQGPGNGPNWCFLNIVIVVCSCYIFLSFTDEDIIKPFSWNRRTLIYCAIKFGLWCSRWRCNFFVKKVFLGNESPVSYQWANLEWKLVNIPCKMIFFYCFIFVWCVFCCLSVHFIRQKEKEDLSHTGYAEFYREICCICSILHHVSSIQCQICHGVWQHHRKGKYIFSFRTMYSHIWRGVWNKALSDFWGNVKFS